MIDKPKGRIETFVEGIFDWCRSQAEEMQDLFTPALEILQGKQQGTMRFARLTLTTCCVLVCGLVIVGFATPRTVEVFVDDSLGVWSASYETTARRVDRFIEEHEINYTHGEDVIDVELHDGIINGMRIHITKAFDVNVKVDGQTLTLKTLPATTREILKELGVKLEPGDLINAELNDSVHKDQEIVIQRVTKELVEETVKTDFEVRYEANSSLVIGETKVTQKGRKGVKKETYELTYVDGEQIDKTLVNTEVVKKKRDKIISYGTKILSGKPAGLKYKEKISNVRAVSYWFPGTPRGVYGLSCEYGTCAVDRKLIPLGSLLYIEGYGYAVANDVGTSIKGKTVDLYMERLGQCGIWGARWTNVYIVNYGNDKRYWE